MRTMMMFGICLVALAGLMGCAAAPMVEFTTPRIMMHVEGKITSVERIHGDLTIQKVDDLTCRVSGTGGVQKAEDHMYRVSGTGEVRINDFHLVEVCPDKVRVHGVDVESKGAMRDVYVEKDKVLNGVHPDKVDK